MRLWKRPGPRVRLKTNRELPRAAEGIESPYGPEARYRHKRETQWTGYMVHLSETCEPTVPHLITHVHTTAATVHEAQCTAPIQKALVQKEFSPAKHLVDAAYISNPALTAGCSGDADPHQFFVSSCYVLTPDSTEPAPALSSRSCTSRPPSIRIWRVWIPLDPSAPVSAPRSIRVTTPGQCGHEFRDLRLCCPLHSAWYRSGF